MKTVCEYQPAYILSSLRTREYIEAERPRPDASIVRRRLSEQAQLTDRTVRSQLVMTEAALWWNVGGRDIMVAQLAHLREVAGWSQVQLGIIPAGARVDFFAGHAFHIHHDTEVVVGTLTDRRTFRDASTVAKYRELFAILRNVAIFDERCLDVIDRAAAYFSNRHRNL